MCNVTVCSVGTGSKATDGSGRASTAPFLPTVHDVSVDYTNLLNRSRYTKGRVRAHIERDIAKRQVAMSRSTEESLNDWE